MIAIGFAISAVLMAFSQRAYFDAVAARKEGVRTMSEVGQEIARHPDRLPLMVDQTKIYLRLLLRRDPDPDIELRRLVALIFSVLTIVLFVLLALN